MRRELSDDVAALFPFQSTHPRGMRLRGALSQLLNPYFNPRIRVGCDLTLRAFSTTSSDFNPRIRVGCDHVGIIDKERILYFNPRIRVGCDLFYPPLSIPYRHFNPRIRVGCDTIICIMSYWGMTISIHASAWDATPFDKVLGASNLISIHASAWDATRHHH